MDAPESAKHPEMRPSFTFPSPQVRVDQHDEASDKMPPPLTHHLTEPTEVLHFSSPLRHHKRTPSAHRQVKETLDAQTQFGDENVDGVSQHRVNQYTILEEIGRGSYGAVHLAKDQFGHEFAVKEFSKARLRKRLQSTILRQGPRGPRRMGPGVGGPFNATPRIVNDTNDALHLIREEIAIMKKLNHPNLVQLYEVLDDPEEDSIYMVLEMCRKGVVMKVGLDEQAEPYSEENCRYWFRDLILAIEYLHAQGVIHRDIKPDNLLLSNDDVLKVVDFGVSEMFEKPDNMRTAKSAGSPAFLPPELCGKHGDVSGTAADIWSMGVSLYCLKYGRIPFNRDGVLDMYEAIRSDEPSLPEDENPDFIDLMQKVLNKDPEQRITMDKLREHPWVTKQGTDCLLSAEENCANMVEPPNELEVNRAFTRKMNHLLCVMKVIHRFKSILGRHRARSNTSTPRADRDSFDASEEKAKAEVIEALLSRRRNFQTKKQKSGIDKETLPVEEVDTQENTTPFLGIGTGTMDEFASNEATPDMVCDSPTAVDFNVYDRAYETAIENITSNPNVSTRRPTVYLTKFVQDTANLKGVSELVKEDVTKHPQDPQEPGSADSTSMISHLTSKLGLSDKQQDKHEA
ncbi:kinase-like domain-containing protein [Fusarium flagelliforme]|uniref:kinase-like domain-containing protein n=1 Tax=Fusarium flagelliforme TaxID=2675880 RepID=UPI001E8EA76B|nr:kinase-like domain-containing protein [Fusarium flagelliforme]KAH7188820.1 kinase-like domain-containing protein [Fusarium flagelliforme]